MASILVNQRMLIKLAPDNVTASEQINSLRDLVEKIEDVVRENTSASYFVDHIEWQKD